MTDEQKKNMCPKCINSDGDCHCITKEEAPFDTFICENGEMFEPYEEIKQMTDEATLY